MDEIVLNYETTGDGPPLLLVHGLGISFNIWKNLIPLLRPHFTLVMVELPGIGKSPVVCGSYLSSSVDALVRLRLKLGLGKWDVFGYSTGSRIAETYVRMDAAHVGRAIFLCPVLIGMPQLLFLRLGFWIDGFFPTTGTWLLRGWRLRFFISLFGFNLTPNPHTDEWYCQISAVPVDVLKETLKIIAKLGLNSYSIPVPFSTIWGEADIIPVTPRKRQPHDYFVKSNHAAPVIAADEVSALITRLLRDSDIVPYK